MARGEVLLLTRRGCQLCEEAHEVAVRVCQACSAPLRVVDVDERPELRERYSDHVPVVFVDGRVHGYWFVDEDRLADAIRA